MTSYRILARPSQGVELRCAHHLPQPAHAFILAALEHDDFQEYGPFVVFTLTLTERQTDQGIEGNIEAQLNAGTSEEWHSLPSLPVQELWQVGGIQA